MNTEYSESDLEFEIELLQDTVQKRQNKTLTIAVIGQHGCGKSSFLNTVMAVFSGEYSEHAHVGNFEEKGEHVTRRLTRYPKEKYVTEDKCLKYKYPTLVDMMGFQNAGDDVVKKTLDLIFNGCLKDGTKLSTENQNQRNILDELQQLMYNDENNLKVDRIIFVASAKSKECPTELIKAVRSQAMDGRRDIPVFGVLTHADKIDEKDTDFPEFEKKFKTSLGLTAMRYLLCASYCDEISRENGRNPNVEVPVMHFLRQVIDPAREAYQSKLDMVDQLRGQLNFKLRTIVEFLLYIVVVFIVLWMMPPSSYIQNQCDKTVNKADHDFQEIEMICRLNSDGKIIDKTAVVFFILGVFVVYNVVDLCMDLYLRFRPDREEILNQRIKTFLRNL
ncbi:uncharacterized protein [Magallana gigas]|uniref:uncharacterized protein n=1 Tax=Magallana gigas TaxID=29159 RepID=UPI003340C0B8